MPRQELLATITQCSPALLSGKVAAVVKFDDREHAKALTGQIIAALRAQLLPETAAGLDPALLEIVRRHFLGLATLTLAQPDGAESFTLASTYPVQGGQFPEHLTT